MAIARACGLRTCCRIIARDDRGDLPMILNLELRREGDGRWLVRIRELPGTVTYAETAQEAIARAKALALRALADRLDRGEASPELASVAFRTTSTA
jgi:predicted RNase H-like HicB family nuclease